MGTNTIRVDDEAYDRLESRKRPGESFSETIKRLAGDRSFSELAGTLSNTEASAVREAIEDSREYRERELDDLVTRFRSSSSGAE